MNYKFLTIKENGYIYVIDIIEETLIKSTDESAFNSFVDNINSHISHILSKLSKENSKIIKKTDDYYITITDPETNYKLKIAKKTLEKWKKLYNNNIELFI